MFAGPRKVFSEGNCMREIQCSHGIFGNMEDSTCRTEQTHVSMVNKLTGKESCTILSTSTEFEDIGVEVEPADQFKVEYHQGTKVIKYEIYRPSPGKEYSFLLGIVQ